MRRLILIVRHESIILDSLKQCSHTAFCDSVFSFHRTLSAVKSSVAIRLLF